MSPKQKNILHGTYNCMLSLCYDKIRLMLQDTHWNNSSLPKCLNSFSVELLRNTVSELPGNNCFSLGFPLTWTWLCSDGWDSIECFPWLLTVIFHHNLWQTAITCKICDARVKIKADGGLFVKNFVLLADYIVDWRTPIYYLMLPGLREEFYITQNHEWKYSIFVERWLVCYELKVSFCCCVKTRRVWLLQQWFFMKYWFFFLSGFSFTDTYESQDSRGLPFLALTSVI